MLLGKLECHGLCLGHMGSVMNSVSADGSTAADTVTSLSPEARRTFILI